MQKTVNGNSKFQAKFRDPELVRTGTSAESEWARELQTEE
jgi:hypothetical protein